MTPSISATAGCTCRGRPAQDGFWPWLIATAVGIAIAVVSARFLGRRESETGQKSYPILAGATIAIGVSVLALLVLAPLELVIPEPEGRFARPQGGAHLGGSFTALLVGLVFYTSSFIAEIVRAGIQSVSSGQTEAARSVGLSPPADLAFRHVPPGHASRHSADDQSVPEPDEELQPGRRHRVSGPGERGELHDANSARNLLDLDGDGHLSGNGA